MIDNNDFINRIRVKKVDNTIDIVRRLRNNEINVKNLNETQKKEVYLFLKKEVIRKRNKLDSLKNTVLRKRKQKNNYV